MANNHLHEVRRFQKIAGLLKEDEDLDLSDTPKFDFLRSEIKSALRDAGVDLNRSVWVDVTQGQHYTEPVEMSIDTLIEELKGEARRFESDDIQFDTEVEDVIDPLTIDSQEAPLPARISVIFSDAIEYTVFQEPEGTLDENENDLDLSDTPESFDVNPIKWLYPDVMTARYRLETGDFEDYYYEYNPEDRNYTISIPIYGRGRDGKKYRGIYTSDVPDLELDDLDLDPEKIDDIELREDKDDLDLSDSPQFDSLVPQIKSNLKKAGVDITRPFWVNRDSEEGEDGGFGGMRLTDIDDFIKEVEEFVTGYINVDLSDAQIEYDIDDDVSDAIKARRKRRAYPIITISVKGPDPNSIADRFHVFQGEDLSENDDLDLSDTPEFEVNYDDDLWFIEWLGEREVEEFVVGADHDYDIYNIGIGVLNDLEKTPRLLKRVYKNYLKYKKRYGIK